ncbi:TPA: hypothetical protein RKT01_002946 [Burkholderia vietnamiensis]|nr:hypothetical protein [Burkholderia vietnamiensis]
MTTPQDIIRRDVLAMTSYPVPDASGFVKLDAMENPYPLPAPLAAALGERLAQVALNRYPAPRPGALLDKLRRTMGVPAACDVPRWKTRIRCPRRSPPRSASASRRSR